MFDGHVHFLPRDVLRWLEKHEGIVIRRERRDATKAAFLVVEGKWAFELKPAFVEEELFLHEQEAAGVAHSLLSPIPQLFLYELPPAVTREAAAVYNDGLAQVVSRHPQRLSALATVPLNDGKAAADELVRTLKTGFRGAIVGPGVRGGLLSDPELAPFWEEADAREAIVFVHPLLNEDPRLKRYQMPQMIGVPWETTVAATDLIMSGMLDRYPKVRILLAHGGGFLPYQVSRMNKACEVWPGAAVHLKATPEQYLRRFWYDTVLWDPAALQYLAGIVGPDRLVPGSDFPFDLSRWPPGDDGIRGHHELMGDKSLGGKQVDGS